MLLLLLLQALSAAADLQLCSLRYLQPVQESAARWALFSVSLSLSSRLPQQELLQLQHCDCEF